VGTWGADWAQSRLRLACGRSDRWDPVGLLDHSRGG